MSAIELKEAIARLARDPHDRLAVSVLRGVVETMTDEAVRKRVVREGDRDDAIQEVFLGLWQHFGSGNAPADGAHAYVRAAVKNWGLSLIRRRKLTTRSDEVALPDTDGPSPDQGLVDEDEARTLDATWGTLERVAAYAIGNRSPVHRAALERGWAELKSFFKEGASQQQVLEAAGEHDGEASRGAIARLHTRQRRTRTALREAAEALRHAGELDAASAEVVERALAHFVRRQVSEPGSRGRLKEEA